MRLLAPLVAILAGLISVPAAHAQRFTPGNLGSAFFDRLAGSISVVRPDDAPPYWTTEVRHDRSYGYARLNWTPSPFWQAGERHGMAARVRFTTPGRFVSALRWDNYTLYGGDGFTVGIDRYAGDDRGRLIVERYDGSPSAQIGPAFALPAHRWLDLEVDAVLGRSVAASVDGREVASGPWPGWLDDAHSRVTKVRAALTATGDPARTTAMDLAELTVDQPLSGRRR